MTAVGDPPQTIDSALVDGSRRGEVSPPRVPVEEPRGRPRVFGPDSSEAFAALDREGEGWVDLPGPNDGAGLGPPSEFDRKWPAFGMARLGVAFELSGSGHDDSGGRRHPSSAGGFTFPTPSASEPDSWRYVEVVDRDGAPPSHPNQRFYDKATGRIVQKTLEHVALMWPTPTVQDARNNGGPAQHARRRPPLNARADGPLNPVWVEWLMGFPPGWTKRSAPGVGETSGRPGPAREVVAVAACEGAAEAAPSRRSRARSAHHGAHRGAARKLRSPRHPEVAP